MAKKFDMTIDINAKTAQAVAGIGKVDASLKTLVSQTRKVDNTFKALAGVVGSFYIVSKGIDAAKAAFTAFTDTASRFEQYEARMGAFTTSTSQMKAEMARAREFAVGFNQDIASVTETMIMMKNYGLDASNESLQTYTNTAIGAGKDVKQFAEAMADALQGENERLKEFGIKAAQQGDKIKYHWTDSMGETHDLIIEKNNQIIDSTLRAIFNEKYAGQAEAFKNSWAGHVQGMKNTWTDFKLKVADAGLFAYFKSLGTAASEYITAGFNDGRYSAKRFADDTISFINMIIKGVGYLVKAISGAANLMRTVYGGFLKLDGAIGGGLNKMAIDNAKKELAELQQKKNEILSSGNGVGITVVNADIREKTKALATYTKRYNEYIEMRKKGDAAVEAAARSQANINKILDDVMNLSTKSTKNLTGAQKELADADARVKAEREAARKKLEEIIKANAKNTLGTKKNTKANKDAAAAAKKYASELKKAQGYYDDLTLSDRERGIKQLEEKVALIRKMMGDKAATKAWEEGFKRLNGQAESFADKLQKAFGIKNDSLFSDMYQNLMSSISNIGSAFNGGDAMDVAMAAGQARIDGLNAVMPGLGDAIKTAGDFIGGLFSDSAEDFKRAAGRSDFDNTALNDIRSILEKNEEPQLTATRKMLEHIKSMDNSFDAVAAAISTSAGIDISGQGYTPDTSGVLGGLLYAKSTELLGSGLQFGQNDIASIMQGQIDVVKYQAEKVTESFLGIINTSSVKNTTQELSDTIKNDLTDAIKDSIDAVSEAVDILGFDVEAFKAKLNDYALDIGKLNFKDLDPKEQAEALKSAIGESLSQGVRGALSSIADPQMYQALDSVRQAGEDYITTLVRVGVTYETVKMQLQAFGQSVDNFAQSEALVQAAGGLDQWKSAMDQFVQGFFTNEEQKAFLQNQLQYALSVYDIALPASKEQFKALVLETQEKILSTKAKIDAMKAEIAAQVEAGKISLAVAYGELDAKGQIAQAQSQVIKGQVNDNNYLIRSAHNAGQAAVGFGQSVNNSIKAMAGAAVDAVVEGAETAVDGAGNIDYSRITSPAIQAAEAELSNLEGLYGTLMNNMGDFSTYYGDVATAASSAAEKIDELTKSMIDIANLKGTWGGDPVEAARLTLEATRKVTGLTDLTYENFLDKFNALTADGKGLSQDVLNDWKSMSDALRGLHDAQEKANADLNNLKESARNAFYDLFDTSSATIIGGLDRAIRLGDYSAASSEYSKALNNLKTSATTRDEYFLRAARLNEKIQRIAPDNPNKGVEDRLDKINDEIRKLREEQYRLQGEVARNTSKPIISGEVA